MKYNVTVEFKSDMEVEVEAENEDLAKCIAEIQLYSMRKKIMPQGFRLLEITQASATEAGDNYIFNSGQ